MKKFSSMLAGAAFVLLLPHTSLQAQQSNKSTIPFGPPIVVNFTELAQQEALHPLKEKFSNKEEDEAKHKGIPTSYPIPPDAKVTKIDLPLTQTRTQSPPPVIAFGGLVTNGTVIPPDVQGTAGLSDVMITLNSQFRIQNKSGTTLSTVSVSSFFSATGGSGFFDPRITYDPFNDKWIISIGGNVPGGHAGFFLAISQTSDPTGSWFEYSIDAQAGTGNFLDFPSLGFNKNWIVETGNVFSNSGFYQNTKIFVLNKSTLYGGSTGTVSSFTDGTFTIQPVLTYDNTLSTEYLVSRWASNSGGNGFVRLFNITGSVGSPVFAEGNTVGINQPWSSPLAAPQSGNSNKIDLGDDRISACGVYRNGFLYCSQTVGLPSINANHSSVQWWKIDPVAATVSQFSRVDDPTGINFYGYPSVAVNSNDDLIIGYSAFSASTFASSAYSYHAAADAANTTESPLIYKNGAASYFISDGSRNRWGDYNAVTVDPVDNSLWALTEFAQTPANTWSTWWANVAASNSSTCGFASNLGSSNITSTSATLTWSAAVHAIGYNIQYRQVGTSTWTTTTSSTTSVNVSGLIPNTQYEFQVQTDCGGGNLSGFTGSANFTTLTQVCNDVYEPNNSKGKAKAIPVNTDVFAAISVSGDIDWFSFPNSSATPNIKVTLTNLTQDYNLQLYSTTGAKLKTSKNCCTLDETVIYNTSTVGTYTVKVYGFNSNAFDNANCYTLHVYLSSTPFKLEGEEATQFASDAITVYPNPNNGNMTIEYTSKSSSDVQLKVYNLIGNVVYADTKHAEEGINNYSISQGQLSSGMYVIEISAGGQIERMKFMIEK